MKIRISGASGYLGTTLSKELIKSGHEVLPIQRKILTGSFEMLSKEIEGSDVIINLAGAPILQRWTKKNKQTIYDSRVKVTRNIVKAIHSLPKDKQPKKFISASAVGIYKAGLTHDENSNDFDEGFVGSVTKDWEAASKELLPSVQRVIFRIGLVVGKNSLTIKKLILPFKLGLGATIGNGRQPFPFVHEKDVVEAFKWAVQKSEKSETYNLVAPENVTNRDFTKALAKALSRPAIFSIPKILFTTVLGEAAALLTESPEVKPFNLLKTGHKFYYPDLTSALDEIIKNKK